MLTPEERQRIEEEEHRRIGEEQYRAAVRAKLQAEHAPPVKRRNRVPWILGIGVVLILGTFVATNSRTPSKTGDTGGPAAEARSNLAPVPPTRYRSFNQKVATGQIIVKANGYVQDRITITPDMVEPTVTGNFNASGGSGNDIRGIIADETNYTNWINGHEAQVFWSTQGNQTTGKLEVRLQPGIYYLVLSSQFSAFTDKQVFLELDLNYKKPETYY